VISAKVAKALALGKLAKVIVEIAELTAEQRRLIYAAYGEGASTAELADLCSLDEDVIARIIKLERGH